MSYKLDKDDEIKRLVKERDELIIDIESSEHLNRLLKKLINTMLISTLNKQTCHFAELSVKELICLELQEELALIENSHYLLGDGKETKHFKADQSASGHYKRSFICKGCNKNFALLEMSFIRTERAYTDHCMKECAEYKKLGK